MSLLKAVEAKSISDVALLLSQNANVTAATSDGVTPLMAAVTNGCPTEIIEALIIAGSDINATANVGHKSPIITHAIMRGATMAVIKLLEHKADPNAKNARGVSPLSAAAKRCPNITQILIDAGAR
jgi:ankyrin repeat protein